MLHVLAQFRRLMALCIKGPGGKISLALFALVVGLDLLSVYVTVLIIDWTKAFYSALEAMDGAGAVWQVGVFFAIVAANSVRHLITQFFRKRLEMRWRQRLTEGALDIWLQNKAYWHLANTTFATWGDTTRGPRGVGIDNPDQRIADDCRLFVQGIMSEALDLIGRVVGLFSYLAILWNLAQFPLSLGFIGLPIEIPHYMIWAAFLYVALSSLLTHALGYPLKGLVVEQQRREANFRFALARLRTNFDEVALSAGEKAERSVLDTRFTAIVGNWKKLVNRELILASFTFPFNHSVLRIPLFVALPGYLAGHVAFGGLMQLSTAFSSVVTTLSWFIFSYRDLADLVAASSRLDNFLQAARRAGATANSLSPVVSDDENLHVEQLALRTPDERPLLTLPGLSIHRGEAVWLSGASGLGKTTFLKALAGIWSFGEGLVRAPQARMLFLPQKAYFPIGDAYSAMAYPRDAAEFDKGELDRVLDLVGMSAHAGVDFGRNDTMTGHGLSGGEQQRLALARLILQKPDWALLDEPTSALDGAAEAELFALVRRELPQTTLVIVAHRPPQGISGLRRVDLDNPNTPTTGLQPA